MTSENINKAQIAARYSVSRRTIESWMKRGILPYYRIGNVVRFAPGECDGALQRFHRGNRGLDARGPLGRFNG